jgi:hypothetical protein
MDSREAKEILSRYRPGETATDPKMGEALELARHDKQLGAWLAKRHAAQTDSPTQPESLRAGKPGREHIIPLSRPALILIGLAAVMLLAIFLWSWMAPKPKDPFTSYRDRMARMVQRSYPMAIAATDQSQIREYFRTNGTPVEFTLPRNLEKLPGKGAAVFTWNRHPVALIGLDGGVNTNLYIFLIKRSAFPDVPVPAKPEFARVGRLLTASWTVGDRVYLLAGPNDQPLLQSYLE